MSNYILSIDNLINSFEIIDAYKPIKYRYESKNANNDYQIQDYILGYYKHRGVSLIFSVQGVNDNSVMLDKIMEINNPIGINEILDNRIIDTLQTEGEAVKISDAIFNNILNQFELQIKDLLNSSIDTDNSTENVSRQMGGENILLYGVPGSGKSYTINTQYCDDETKIERIVFHPDYMNTDLIGQILPTIKDDGTVTYEFTPGPFTKILKKAYEDPVNKYYLVIEEINRGNAPAIFGEVFQLLDRDKDGTSTYSITNENVAKIVYGNSEQLISLPSNLSILATMNTADQNVFTLDTAFQRRWVMKMIKNDIESAEHADVEILDTGVTWKIFAETVNNQIIQSNSATMSSEDKRLGAYFITSESLLEDKENMYEVNFNSLFAEKVIKYLWDDAFKFGRDKLFNPEYKSLERIIEEFSGNKGLNRFDIFETSIKDILKERAQNRKDQEIIEEEKSSNKITEE